MVRFRGRMPSKDSLKVIAIVAVSGGVFAGGYSGYALEGFSACPPTSTVPTSSTGTPPPSSVGGPPPSTVGAPPDTTGNTFGDTTGSSGGGCPPNDTTPGDTTGTPPVDNVSENAPPGGTVETNETVTSDDPVGTSVTTPTGGQVTIEEGGTTTDPPPGYTFLDGQVSITAPAATAAQPLQIVFRIHDSLLPEGVDETNLAMFRNGLLVGPCTGTPGTADPDPCVADRAGTADGVEITVLTSQASDWNFGVLEAAEFTGFSPPLHPADDPTLLTSVKRGSAVLLSFSLNGDRGLDIFESPPESQRVTCETDTPLGAAQNAASPGRSTGLTYDSLTDEYTFTWKTSTEYTKGSCRRLTLHFADVGDHSAYFRFR